MRACISWPPWVQVYGPGGGAPRVEKPKQKMDLLPWAKWGGPDRPEHNNWETQGQITVNSGDDNQYKTMNKWGYTVWLWDTTSSKVVTRDAEGHKAMDR